MITYDQPVVCSFHPQELLWDTKVYRCYAIRNKQKEIPRCDFISNCNALASGHIATAAITFAIFLVLLLPDWSLPALMKLKADGNGADLNKLNGLRAIGKS
jgi:hypothetical protein